MPRSPSERENSTKETLAHEDNEVGALLSKDKVVLGEGRRQLRQRGGGKESFPPLPSPPKPLRPACPSPTPVSPSPRTAGPGFTGLLGKAFLRRLGKAVLRRDLRFEGLRGMDNKRARKRGRRSRGKPLATTATIATSNTSSAERFLSTDKESNLVDRST